MHSPAVEHFFAKKPLSAFQDTDDDSLRRVLSARALTALGIGAVIGTGIFVLTGTAAANHAGPALAIAFIIAGIACALAGMCYAEFAAMLPVSGSAYSYCYATLGEGVAWFIGWNLVLEYLVSVGTVSVGWSAYLVSVLAELGIHIPAALSSAPFGGGSTGAIVNLPAMLIVAAITGLCYAGIRRSALVNAWIVAIKVTVVVLFILFGAHYVDPANWHPFVPPNTGEWGQFGPSGVLTASGVIFFAYVGFDAIATTARETRNPQRDMPIGILVSLGLCSLLYIAVALVLTGMVHYTDLDVAAPVALALNRFPSMHWLSLPIKIGAIAGMTSVMLVMTLAQARTFHAMARDGLLWKCFERVHPRHHTPGFATLVTGAVSAIIGGLFPVKLLGELVSIGTLAAFATVCIGVLVLRRTQPHLERPFRVPLPWVSCSLGAITCITMMLSLGTATWLRLLIWTALGALFYFLYGYRHSKLRSPPAA